jgi:hypothetical protein
MLQACGLLREGQQAALQTGGKLEETSFMTPLLQGGLPKPLLARMHTCIQQRNSSALLSCESIRASYTSADSAQL